MRLINCTTLQLEEFFGSSIPEYAVLSHTWAEEEVSLAEFTTGHDAVKLKRGYHKIALICEHALEYGLQYAWVDTCCIDNTSSAELSEAINSMFQWYRDAKICIAYLSDVSKENFKVEFPLSRWFRRGWTLQELLAPPYVDFYDQDWKPLGSKNQLALWISEFTRIDVSALNGGKMLESSAEAGFSQFCVAKRMSWASDRETTRVEDIAYCLLGLFGVNMPLLYGEGQKAFKRLQEEIIKSHDDDSILAWGLDDLTWLVPRQRRDTDLLYRGIEESLRVGHTSSSSILASSPKDFRECQSVEYSMGSSFPFSITNIGLQMELPLVPPRQLNKPPMVEGDIVGWLGLLNCSVGRGPAESRLLGIILQKVTAPGDSFMVQRVGFGYPSRHHTCRVGPLQAIASIHTKVTILPQSQALTVRTDKSGFCQYIINASVIWNIGYSVDRKLCLREQPGSHPHAWDPNKLVYTTELRTPPCLLQVSFAYMSSGIGTFSVFLRGRNFLVRSGNSFSKTQIDEFDALLSDAEYDDASNIVVKRYDGLDYRIVVTTKEKIVCHWQNVEVTLSSVRC